MNQNNKHGDASYHQKLIRFNATDKYRGEMEFMKGIIDAKPGQSILDYGCGLGHMVCYLQEETKASVFGFDVQEWWAKDERPNWFKDSIWFKFDTIYFMHSFAHIPDIVNQLVNMRENFLNYGGKIVVLTPNKLWLDKIDNINYVPDPTVHQHYSQATLLDIISLAGFMLNNYGQYGESNDDQQERIYLVASV